MHRGRRTRPHRTCPQCLPLNCCLQVGGAHKVLGHCHGELQIQDAVPPASIQAANLHSHYSNCTGGSSRGQQAVCAHERTRGQEECVACLLNHLQRALLWGQLGVHFQVPLQGRGGLKTERD